MTDIDTRRGSLFEVDVRSKGYGQEARFKRYVQKELYYANADAVRRGRRLRFEGRAVAQPVLTEVLARLRDVLPPELLPQLVDAMELARRLGEQEGSSVSRQDLMQAALGQLVRRFEWRMQAESDSLSAEALGSIGWSPERIAEERRAGRLIAIETDGRWIVPEWQFDSDFAVLDGVPELIAAFPGGLSALNAWTALSGDYFDGARPRDVIRRGDWTAVVELVEEHLNPDV